MPGDETRLIKARDRNTHRADVLESLNGHLFVAAGGASSRYREYTITLALVDTEYSQALPSNLTFFEFQCRTAADVRWSFTPGRVAGSLPPYRTLKSGDYYSSPDLNYANPPTLYFAGGAGLVVELLCWTL
jgi:hypothetical protein